MSKNLIERVLLLRAESSDLVDYLNSHFSETAGQQGTLTHSLRSSCRDFALDLEGVIAEMKSQERITRYYVEGQEVSKAEAEEIRAKNAKYLQSADVAEFAKCKFVVEIKK